MAINFPSGTQGAPAKILQTASTVFTDIQNIGYNNQGTGWTQISGFSHTMTTSVANSKFIIVADVYHGVGGGTELFRIVRVQGGAGTVINSATNTSGGALWLSRAGGHSSGTVGYEYGQICKALNGYDNPGYAAGTSVTYRIEAVNVWDANLNVFINRARRDGYNGDQSVYMGRGSSTFTLMEVAP